MIRAQLPNPGMSELERQNLEFSSQKIYSHALYWTLIANKQYINKVVGTIPANSLIIGNVPVVIKEPFNGNNIWIKIGTQANYESVGKIISHVAGVFNLSGTPFGTLPTDYGVIFKQPKQIVVSLVPEVPSTLAIASVGVAFGIIPYIDLTQVEGYP